MLPGNIAHSTELIQWNLKEKKIFSQFVDQIWLMARQRKDFKVEIRTIIHDALIRLGLEPDRLVLSKNVNCPATL